MKKLKSELTPTQIKCLKNQTFTDNEPGTLLKDFSSLLDFIGTTGVPVSKKNNLFAIKLLPELNQLMSNPLGIKLKRPQQKSFPHINGLYLLLRASGLTTIIFEKKDAKLMINSDILANWKSLNLTERYFSLFYAWWHRGSEEIIGGDNQGFYTTYFAESKRFFQQTLSYGLDIKTKPNYIDHARFLPGLHNLALMELFGFIQIKLNPVLSKENWPIANIKPTTWGRSVINCFSNKSNFIADMISEYLENDQLESWGTELKTYIPAWKNNLAEAVIPITEGDVIFKISLGNIYRKMAVPSTISLDEFAGSILAAFDFSNDHLYEFIYKND